MSLSDYNSCDRLLLNKAKAEHAINVRHCDLEGLAPSVRCALELIFRQFAGLPFKLEHLSRAAAGRITPADLRAAVPGLLRRQCVASACNTWGERLYFIPQELLSVLHQQWIRPRLEPKSGSDVKLIKEAKRGLALDVFRSLVWIASHGIPITAKGFIHQRVLSKLSQQTALQQEDVSGLSLKYSHQDIYPAHTVIILDLLLELNILTESPKAWQLNVEGLSLWLRNNLAGMNSVLFQRMLLKYVPAEKEPQHFVYSLSSADWLVGEWYSYERFIGWLQEEGLLCPELPEERQNWLWSWLEAMCGFGWLELGCDDAGEHAFRWIDLPLEWEVSQPRSEPDHHGQAGSCFYIQPDFEIMVPPDVPFDVRWELEAFSESIVTDRLSIYRITRESVAKGLRLGRSWQDMRLHLQRYSPGIPTNVIIALEEWGRQRSELQGGATFPRLADPSSLSGGQREVPLDEGIYRGMILGGENMAAYRWNDAIPERKELFPGLEQVPGMWLKTARSYHSSTAWQMVSQAIQWQTLLALQIGGQWVEYLPASLEDGEDWQVAGKLFASGDAEGYEAILAPEDWEAMRLLLPVIDVAHQI